MNNFRPIGIFDSGIGGLSVMSNIHRLLPFESLSYIADSLNIPYGTKDPKIILNRSIAATDFLVNKQEAKIIVVACNTATAISINELRDKFKVPIIGMEPAVKPASEASIVNKVGVLATSGTVDSAKFSALLDSHSKTVKFFIKPCPGLVDLIEQGLIDSPEVNKLVESYCLEFKKNDVDTIVLGCTHYFFIKDLIKNLMGPEIQIIDTGYAVAKQLKRKLDEFNLHNSFDRKQIKIWTNQSDNNNKNVIKRILADLDINYDLFSIWP